MNIQNCAQTEQTHNSIDIMPFLIEGIPLKGIYITGSKTA
jgi:hypothetical protein